MGSESGNGDIFSFDGSQTLEYNRCEYNEKYVKATNTSRSKCESCPENFGAPHPQA